MDKCIPTYIYTCIQVARSRGGYYAEEQLDPDAPSDAEMQIFLRNCLPLRLTAAKQMGLQALPGAKKVSQMQVCVPVHVCMYVRSYIHAYMHKYMNVRRHTHTHTY
jgi:hypothetical protein